MASEFASDGAPGWLHICVLCWIGNAMKFTVFAIVQQLKIVRRRGELRT